MLLTLSVLLAIAAFVGVWYTSGATQTIFGTLAGSAIGLAAAIQIQAIASREQTEMVRAVTLDAEGINPLPAMFHQLRWCAYATKFATAPDAKHVQWRTAALTKIGGSGPRFVTYSLVAINLADEPTAYRITFVGSKNCVIAAITREDETTSSVTFDTGVSGAGVYFGVSYLTDWGNERNLTLMMVGSNELHQTKISSLSPKVVAAFHRWYRSIDFNVGAAYDAFPPPPLGWDPQDDHEAAASMPNGRSAG